MEVEDVPAEAAMGLLGAPSVLPPEDEPIAVPPAAAVRPTIPAQVAPADAVTAPVTAAVAPATAPAAAPTAVSAPATPTLAEPVDPATRPTVWVDPHTTDVEPVGRSGQPTTLHLPLVPSQASEPVLPTIAPTHANPLEPAVTAAIALSVREAVREAMLESAAEAPEAAAPGVPARFDRTVMLATAAGLVGGLVSSAGLSFLLG